MHINEYRELKELCAKVTCESANQTRQRITESNQIQVEERRLWSETRAWVDELIDEGYDLSDYTWSELYESYVSQLDENIADKLGLGFLVRDKDGRDSKARQEERERQKAQREKEKADREAKASKKREDADRAAGRASEVRDDDGNSVRYTRGSDGSTRKKGQKATLNGKQVRWNVDSSGKGSWKPVGGSSSSDTKPEQTKPEQTKPEQTKPEQTKPETRTEPVKPAKPVRQAQTGDKAKDMAAWAKANPTLAKAQQERERTRGTSATSNPMLRNSSSRLPSPAKATPTPTTPKPDTSQVRAMSKSPSKIDTTIPKVKPVKPVSEGIDVFDIVYEHLIESGFHFSEASDLMLNMDVEKIIRILEEEKRKAIKDIQSKGIKGYMSRGDLNKERNKGKERTKLTLMPEIIESFITELRRSEKEGYGSPESRSDMSPTGYLGGDRMMKKKRGEAGGRHSRSGSQGEYRGKDSERGRGKNDPQGEYRRLNPEEEKGRQMKRGTRAASDRSYGYRSGRQTGD